VNGHFCSAVLKSAGNRENLAAEAGVGGNKTRSCGLARILMNEGKPG